MVAVASRWSALAAWIVAAIVVWFLFVPGRLSASAFMWMNAIALVLIFGVAWFVSHNQPPRTGADLLYDAEHDQERRDRP